MGIPAKVCFFAAFFKSYQRSNFIFQDCLTVGKFIATKVVLNEFNAFADLASYNPERPGHVGDLDQR